MDNIIQFPQPRPADPMEAMAKAHVENLMKLLELIQEKFKAQYLYNLQTNVPRGTMPFEEAGEHAMRRAVAGAWNTFHKWSTSDAVDLAEAVLEDANCHPCAKALNESAKFGGIR